MAAVLLALAGTVALWVVSATLAVGLAGVLALASFSSFAPLRWAGEAGTTLTRGVPTSLLVVVAGIGSTRVAPAVQLPVLFPGTPDAFQGVAWAIALALAAGSAGHLAVIFRAGCVAVGRHRLEQSLVLGMPAFRRLRLLVQEAGRAALPPTGARLVHHLHNTAFAALFPVAELFGWLEDQANATFEVTRYAAICAALYVALSGLIWIGCRALEFDLGLAASGRRRSRRALAMAAK